MDEQDAKVLVSNDQLSLAIGKGGQNVRLAAKLTGYKIDLNATEMISDLDAAVQAAASRIGEPLVQTSSETKRAAFDALFGAPAAKNESEAEPASEEPAETEEAAS